VLLNQVERVAVEGDDEGEVCFLQSFQTPSSKLIS